MLKTITKVIFFFLLFLFVSFLPSNYNVTFIGGKKSKILESSSLWVTTGFRIWYLLFHISVLIFFLSLFNFIFIVDTIVDVPISCCPICPSNQAPSPVPPAITTLLSVSMGYACMFFG